MTTDMSERERMERYRQEAAHVDFYMRRARESSKYTMWPGSEEMSRHFRKETSYFVRVAREANRQAVRLWYGRTTRS